MSILNTLKIWGATLLIWVLYPQIVFSSAFELPNHGHVIGRVFYSSSDEGESLIDVGLRHDIGYYEIIRANPNINHKIFLPRGTKVRIPEQFTLPHTSWKGIVIDLSHYRLFYFLSHEKIVLTYPVGIGRAGWDTPRGQTKVIAKIRHPSWHPSLKLRKAAEKKGVLLPAAFPANAANPLGDYVLRLGWSGYLIHGTHQEGGVGMRISAGCIRMLPNDIEELFAQVQVNTQVRII